MTDLDTLVDAHLAVWNADPGPDRTQQIAGTYAAEVVVGEPDAVLHGHDGMEQAIDALHTQIPGAVLTRTGPLQSAHDMVTYGWTLGHPDQPAVASERDVLIVRDRQIVTLYVVIDAA